MDSVEMQVSEFPLINDKANKTVHLDGSVHRHYHPHVRYQNYNHNGGRHRSHFYENLVAWYHFYGIEFSWAVELEEVIKLMGKQTSLGPLCPFVIEFRRKFRSYKIPKMLQHKSEATETESMDTDFDESDKTTIISDFSEPFDPFKIIQEIQAENKKEIKQTVTTTSIVNPFETLNWTQLSTLAPNDDNDDNDVDTLIIDLEIYDPLDTILMKVCNMI